MHGAEKCSKLEYFFLIFYIDLRQEDVIHDYLGNQAGCLCIQFRL